MARVVRRRRDGSYVLRLDDETIDLLATLAAQLDPLLDDQSADPGLRRLFPPAHTDDVLAEAAWQIEQGEALRDSRRNALAALDQPADEPMDEARLVDWMQGVNALRLVLAERLGMEDPADEEDQVEAAVAELARTDDPAEREAIQQRLAAWQLFDLLGALVAHAVRALGQSDD